MDDRQLVINRRVREWVVGNTPTFRPTRKVLAGKTPVELKPCTEKLSTHTELSVMVPSTGERFISDDELFNGDGIKKLEPVGITMAQRVDDANATYRRLWGIIQPEYNLLEPFTIFDSEPFVRQAINRKISLMFRNGFEIVGDQDPDIEYIQRRLDAMEFVMERSTENFYKQILTNLLLCSNCFLQKIRLESATIVSQKPGRPVPVAAYRMIPAHMIFPYLENGVPSKWRRFFDTGAPFEDIPLEDIIHLKWDVKTTHRFGTPRTVGVRDDLFALRRLEENVELLFINFLFPLFHIAVGNEQNPAGFDGESGQDEVQMIQWQIQNMPKEGMFVTDERVVVKSVGSEGKALEYSKLMDHYKSRIYVGLGMSAVDMGDSKGAGSRSTADNISQNLKDSIKCDLETFGGLIRMSMFKEFFLEATYSVSVQKAVARTWLHFHEIDLDNKIKFENHVIQLFLNNLVDEDEARQLVGKKAFKTAQRKKLNFDLHVVRLVKETEEAKADSAIEIQEEATKQQLKLIPVQTEHAEKQAKIQMKLSATQVAHHERKNQSTMQLLQAKTEHFKATGQGGAPQRATAKKSSPARKSVQNKETPTNQHGSNPGPTKAKSRLEHLAAECTDTLVQLMNELRDRNGTVDHEAYQNRVGPTLAGILSREEGRIQNADDESYTRQAREGLNRLAAIAATTYDPELLSVLALSALSSDEEGYVRVSRTDYSEATVDA